MRTIRYRDEESSIGGIIAGVAIGALAGFAAGVVLAQKTGGFGGLGARLRDGLRRVADQAGGGNEFEDELDEDDIEEEDEADLALEERVLAAFRRDAVLNERAIDIGSIGDGIVELTGWVNTNEESEHAAAVAQGVADVMTVVNRLNVGDEERLLLDNERRLQEGDAALTESAWEGQRVGTGRPRQGTSNQPGRHADPKVGLEERWLGESEAVREAADDLEGIAERRRRAGKRGTRGGRTDGSAIAPSGVPKGDHVVNADELSGTEDQRAD